VNEIVVVVIKGIEPLPEVKRVGIIVFMTGEGGGGGKIPPPFVAVTRVRGVSDEVASSLPFPLTEPTGTHKISPRGDNMN